MYIIADTAHMYVRKYRYSASNQNFIQWVTVWDIPCLVLECSFSKQTIKVESINGTLYEQTNVYSCQYYRSTKHNNIVYITMYGSTIKLYTLPKIIISP